MKGRHVAIAAGIACLLMLGAALVVANSRITRFLQSEEFRTLAGEALGRTVGGKARIAEIQWSGPAAYTEEIALEGAPVLHELTLSQVRAEWDWRAILGGAWRLRGISITRAAAILGAGEPSSDAAPARLATGESLPSWLPQRFEIEPIDIGSASLNWPGGTLENSRLRITPDAGTLDFRASGGTLRVGGLPALTLEQLRGKQQGGVFFLTDSALRLGNSGKVQAAGEIGGNGILNVNWQGVELADLLSGDLRKNIAGQIEGRASVRASQGTTGNLTVTDGRIENLPVLSRLATFTGNPAFKRLPVQECRSAFAIADGTVTFTDLVLESRGLLRLEGTLRVAAGGALAGNLSVGVTPQTLQWIPGSRERVFTQSRDGYLWTPVEIGGTVELPTENLSTRLAAAMGEQILEEGASVLQGAPEKAREGVQGILNILAPLVR